MANKVRGEFDLTIDGKVYTARPTFEAIASIEGALNTGAFPLGQKCISGNLGVAEMAQVIHFGIRAVHGRAKTPAINIIGEFLLSEGISEFLGPVGEFLLKAFTGDKDRTAKEATEDSVEGEKLPTPED